MPKEVCLLGNNASCPSKRSASGRGNFDGTDINSVCKDGEEQFLVTADDTGKIRLFSYPASQPKSLSHAYRGHSSHVTSVKFMHDGVRLLSAGGMDTSVLQWRVV
ncbi:hypothetical protein quinque_005647 [Culex quinquefasciatus]